MKKKSKVIRKEVKVMDTQVLEIPHIKLKWYEWVHWDDLKGDARKGGINVPNEPGVYEVRRKSTKKLLQIGMSSNLRMRIKQMLIKGKQHPSGKKILANEDTSRVEVRWAFTDRQAAAEEELCRQYWQESGELPKYAGHTRKKAAINKALRED